MNELLHHVLDAHGGHELWLRFNFVQATIITGGEMFAMKNEPQDPIPRRMTVATKKEWASVTPFGSPGHKTDFTAGRIAIETLDGTVLSERLNPASHAEAGKIDAPWDALDRAYFNGYALWTYLTTPFLFAMDGVQVKETEAWREGTETWRVLRAYFPGSIETHSLIQDFFFGEDLMLRRHDYCVNIAGGFNAAQLTSDYVVADGIRLPTKRRAYTRGPDRRPIMEMLMVAIDFSEVRFE